MVGEGILEFLKTRLGSISASVTSAVAILTALKKGKDYFERSRLIVPNAFPLPEIPSEQSIFMATVPDLSTMLIGREHAMRTLQQAIATHRLTFLYGESGSGKSTLLKLGVARELAQGGTWIPIYLDIWGQHWVTGPQRSLASAVQLAVTSLSLQEDQPPITSETVFARLKGLYASTGRTPIVLLDQIDDYQNAHRDRFYNRETCLFLNPAELCEVNSFWRHLRDLLLSGGNHLHLALATRDDAQSGLHCFQFDDPRVYPLARLDSSDAKTLVHRLAPETVVKKPENGFNDLTARIVNELGEGHGGKILPMQLRVALAGVGRLSGALTPSRLEQVGGAAGLGAQYLESVISDIPGAWPILNAMAQRTDEGGGKAALLSREQIHALCPADLDVPRLLQRLVDDRILRLRLEDSEEETWQLYHDFIASAIVALDQRKRRWPLLLRNAKTRWENGSGVVQWWSRLLSPWMQIRLYWQKIRDSNLRIEDYASFLRLSALRLVVNAVTIVVAVGCFGWVVWSQQKEVERIVEPFFEGSEWLSGTQMSSLWHLASISSNRVKRLALEDLVSNPVLADRFNEYPSLVLTTLGFRSSSLDSAAEISAENVCRTPRSIEGCMWILIASGDQDSETIGRAIVQNMQKEENPKRLAEWGAALAEALERQDKNLSKDAGSRFADAGFARLEPQATRGWTVFYDPTFRKTMNDLSSLAPYLSSEVRRTAIDRLSSLHGGDNDGTYNVFSGVLVSLSKGLNAAQADLTANHLIDIFIQKEASNPFLGGDGLGRAFAVLPLKVSETSAARLADRVQPVIESANVLSSDLFLPWANLSKKAGGRYPRQAAELLFEGIGHAEQNNQIVPFAKAAGALSNEFNEHHAEQFSQVILAELRSIGTPLALSDEDGVALARALVALAPRSSGEEVQSAVKLFSDRLRAAKFAYGQEGDAAQSLSILARGSGGNEVDAVGRVLLDRLTKMPQKAAAGSKELNILKALAGSLQDRDLRERTLIEVSSRSEDSLDCSAASLSMTRDEMPLIIDMLKWPTCGDSRDGLMLRLAELEGTNPKEFGAFEDEADRTTFHANLREFIAWAKEQNDVDGKRFDLDSPPVHNPYVAGHANGGGG